MKLTYAHTRWACNLGIICQACNNNLPPLLFIVFQNAYGISYERLGRLILLNFATQLVVDVVAARYADKIGHRAVMVASEALSAAGLLIIAASPVLPIPMYGGLACGVVVSAIGGGLLEVMVSRISDALPADSSKKAANMALLHSFYCWGQVAVVAISTFFLLVVGQSRWQLLPIIWVALPLTALALFAKSPFADIPEHEITMGMSNLFKTPLFWAAMIMMACAGASEITVSQWSSLFAEKGLGLAKVSGDLAGPCLFAVMMGIGRTFYGLRGAKINLKPFIAVSAGLCVASYLTISFSPNPVLSLAGCAICGLSVSVMWPGTLSLGAEKFRSGGTAMFGLFAMCGDIGCAAGPWLAGFAAESAANGGAWARIGAVLFTGAGVELRAGILLGILFPVAMLATVPMFRDNFTRK